ncbi:alpha/beta fold hydrolase [Microbacterium sp. P06]|uniref:alpha/beta fold hydrolase n=1 Tax=Microbacterium sp. P06 TaxID=3366949 RepID=UPI003744EB7C
MPIIRTAHTELEYFDDGPADGRPVVMAHGFPDEPSTWDDVVDLLPEGVRVIRPYLRGVGNSRVTDPAAMSAQVAALATDLVDLMSALELGPAVLVGHDWGARAAHGAAVVAPQTLTGLVTLSTAYGAGADLTATEALDDAAVAWYRYWLCTATGAEAFRRDPAALVRWAWRHWSPELQLSEREMAVILDAVDTEQFADNVVHYYRHGTGEAPGSAVYAETQATLDEWPAITVPTTFLIGTADGCETLPLARRNASLFSAGRDLIELEGIGHFIPREAPTFVAEAIRGYLHD